MDSINVVVYFDDDAGMVVNNALFNKYGITIIPSVCFCEKQTLVDVLHPDLRRYCHVRNKDRRNAFPSVSRKYLIDLLTNTALTGHDAVYIFCPGRMMTPHYDLTNEIIDDFYRKHDPRITDMPDINVVDTGQIGAGMMLYALRFAVYVQEFHFDIKTAAFKCEEMLSKSKLHIFYAPDSDLPQSNMVTYILNNGRLDRTDSTESAAAIRFDGFAEAVFHDLLASSTKSYAVSFGCDCKFAGNIIGRIQDKIKQKPICVTRYSMIGTYAFGSNSLYVHIFD